MNGEIKEILDNFEKYEARYKLHNETQFIITHREIQILLDYITNLQQAVKDTKDTADDMLFELQQENERLKDNRDWWKDRFFGQQEYDDSHRITAIEYKKRIDKAIEYIENPRHEMSVLTYQNLLNILQNGSEKNE